MRIKDTEPEELHKVPHQRYGARGAVERHRYGIACSGSASLIARAESARTGSGSRQTVHVLSVPSASASAATRASPCHTERRRRGEGGGGEYGCVLGRSRRDARGGCSRRNHQEGGRTVDTLAYHTHTRTHTCVRARVRARVRVRVRVGMCGWVCVGGRVCGWGADGRNGAQRLARGGDRGPRKKTEGALRVGMGGASAQSLAGAAAASRIPHNRLSAHRARPWLRPADGLADRVDC